MRDYDTEELLMHMGVKGMKRPTGLKYKTRKISNSLYQHRQKQIHPNTETSEEDEQSKEWNKEKYVKDTKNKVYPTDPGKSRKSNTESTSKPYLPEYKFSKDKRNKFLRARQSQQMAEANIKKAFERQQHMFDKNKKEKSSLEERTEDAIKRLKKNPLTRYGIRYVNVNSKLGKHDDSHYEKAKKKATTHYNPKNARSINNI